MSATTPQNIAGKRYGLLALAAFLLVLGGAAIYVGSHNYPIRALGLVAVMASAYLVRVSRVRGQSEFPGANGPSTALEMTKGPGRLAWVLALALVVLLGISYFLLHEDAVHGGNARWPADLFAWLGLAFAVVSGYIAAKISARQGR